MRFWKNLLMKPRMYIRWLLLSTKNIMSKLTSIYFKYFWQWEISEKGILLIKCISRTSCAKGCYSWPIGAAMPKMATNILMTNVIVAVRKTNNNVRFVGRTDQWAWKLDLTRSRRHISPMLTHLMYYYHLVKNTTSRNHLKMINVIFQVCCSHRFLSLPWLALPWVSAPRRFFVPFKIVIKKHKNGNPTFLMT